MDVVLVGVNESVHPTFEQPTGYKEHYYNESTGEKGIHTEGFQKVTYKNIYPNIDWVIYSQKEEIKYDFIVHTGGNVADIQLQYNGASSLTIDDGAIISSTPFGSVTEAALYCYLLDNGNEVSAKYILEGNILSFKTSSYDGTLVIDPQLAWASYYGGTGNTSQDGESVAVDLFENVYLCGATASNNNIATTGAHQTTYSGSFDGYIAKFDSTGKRLWATYYGNSDYDILSSVSCDKNGNIYTAGTCKTCNGLATTGSHQTTFGGRNPSSSDNGDGFITKFDSSGQRVWCTLYGGPGDELNLNVVCHENKAVFVAGTTFSDSGIATSGTHKSTHSVFYDNGDVFIVKFDTAGNRLWGTYYGGDTAAGGGAPLDLLLSITSDKNGDIYPVGATYSKNGIATSGTIQPSYGGGTGDWDGFIAKFNGNSGTRIWGSYYGGEYPDGVLCAAVNDTNLYISGYTGSTFNIATSGTYKPSIIHNFPGINTDCFVAKLNASNGSRIWGTYYGSTNTEGPSGISIGNDKYIYITGTTQSTTFISTNGAYQTSFGGGGSDNFLTSFNSSGLLNYGTYYGGSNTEPDNSYYGFNNSQRYAKCLTISNSGKLYIVGLTQSNNAIATSGAHQTTLNGGINAYVAAFEADTVVYIPQLYNDTLWCPGDTVQIVYGTNMPFKSGNNFTVQLSDSNGNFTNAVNIGSRTDTVSDTITCVVPLNTPPALGYRIRIVADSPNRTSWDNQWDIRIKQVPEGPHASSNSFVCTGDTIQLYGTSSSTGVTWNWTGPNSFNSAAKDTFIINSTLSDSGSYILTATLNSTGCSLNDTVDVEMRPTPNKPTAGSNSPVCETKQLNLGATSSTGGVSYSWVGPSSFGSSTQSPTVTNNATSANVGNYILTTTLNGCSNRDTTTVVVLPKPTKPTATATNSPLCQDQNLLLTGSGSTSGATYNWYGPAAFTSTLQNPIRYQATLSHAGTYYVYTTLSGCVSDTDSVTVVVNTDPEVNVFPSPGTTICQGQQVTFTTVPVNAGTATYAWLVNGLPTATGTPLQTTTLNNGDIVQCVMTSVGTCATPFYDTSTGITMTVQQLLTPSVSIASNPSHPLFPNEPITFTATPTNAGGNPNYQWRRNGIDIGGATSAVWGANANALSDGDEICAIVYSNYVCPNPDTAKSNCIPIQIKVGVDDIEKDNGLAVYPNPTTGEFILQSKYSGVLYLNSIDGRQVAEYNVLSKEQRLKLPSDLSPGLYIGRFQTEDNLTYRIQLLYQP
ncbi:MAG: SBBP repeat-containing protein [Chitinophagales bacterium]|nr:SBBP repeat-containing protein [Chitinophagaceae bacterium]MCB9064669.1 SBBP repeat-containing protein [Chitinophagales bacterium]